MPIAKGQSRKTLIQSVERALNILEVIRDNGPSRSTEIARRLGIAPTAANNLVRTLFLRDYLAQTKNGHYVLGCQSYLLGTAADAWTALRQAAAEPMVVLSRETGFTSFLGVEAQGRVIAVSVVEGTGALIVVHNQKWLDQLHCTAAGKLFLAGMTPERYVELKAAHQLIAQTQATVTSWPELEESLKKIRNQGFCVCIDESVYGVSSIAVPVHAVGKNPEAALSLSFSTYFLNAELQTGLVAKLLAAAKEIRARLQPDNSGM